MDSVLTSAEIEFFIETMRERSLSEIGNSSWIDWHERLQKLNQQAVIEASSLRDEQVKETLVSFNKSPILVHEAILISMWKQKVLPHLLNFVPNPESTFVAYSILYQEAIALSLLELIMFHGSGSESLGESAVDLLEYVYDNATQLLVNKANKSDDEGKTLNGRKELCNQKEDLNFGIGIKSLSIIRYLAEYLENVNLGVVSRMYATLDIPLFCVQLLMEKPWQKDGMIYNKGKWIPQKSEALNQIEGQVWLTLRHLLLDKACNTYYPITDSRKLQLMKLMPLLSPNIVDQLSPLAELKHFLCHVSVYVPDSNFKMPLLIETVLEIKNKILQEGKGQWKKIAKSQIDTVFCTNKEKLRQIAQQLSSAYNTDVIEKFETESTVSCTFCGQPAIQRCSKCKNDFYCSRQCQVSDWKDHKEKCLNAN